MDPPSKRQQGEERAKEKNGIYFNKSHNIVNNSCTFSIIPVCVNLSIYSLSLNDPLSFFPVISTYYFVRYGTMWDSKKQQVNNLYILSRPTLMSKNHPTLHSRIVWRPTMNAMYLIHVALFKHLLFPLQAFCNTKKVRSMKMFATADQWKGSKLKQVCWQEQLVMVLFGQKKLEHKTHMSPFMLICGIFFFLPSCRIITSN